MKTFIMLVAFFCISFANAQDCYDPTEQAKNFIYDTLGIHPDVPFQEFCSEELRKVGPIDENDYEYKDVVLVKSGCAVGCVGILAFMYFRKSPEDFSHALREKRPYSENQGKTIEYRYSGGKMKRYHIDSRDSYDYMLSDVENNIRQAQWWGNRVSEAGMASCACSVTVIF